jgi:inosine-uridine nucleoside N-ribohydrolase
VPDHPIILDSDNGDDDIAVLAQTIDEIGLLAPAEGGGDHTTDSGDVGGEFVANDHAGAIRAQRAEGRELAHLILT